MVHWHVQIWYAWGCECSGQTLRRFILIVVGVTLTPPSAIGFYSHDKIHRCCVRGQSHESWAGGCARAKVPLSYSQDKSTIFAYPAAWCIEDGEFEAVRTTTFMHYRARTWKWKRFDHPISIPNISLDDAKLPKLYRQIPYEVPSCSTAVFTNSVLAPVLC